MTPCNSFCSPSPTVKHKVLRETRFRTVLTRCHDGEEAAGAITEHTEAIVSMLSRLFNHVGSCMPQKVRELVRDPTKSGWAAFLGTDYQLIIDIQRKTAFGQVNSLGLFSTA